MLFNSWLFLFLFMPALLAAWRFCSGARSRAACLLCFSLLFYGLWSLPFLPLLLAVCALNCAAAGRICPAAASGRRTGIFILLIGLNLAPLLWFKYSGFIVSNLALLLDASWRFSPPAQAPGISFYTFIQLAWLTGVYRGQIAPPGMFAHTLFSTCFPYVISGPIVRWQELGPQLGALGALSARNLATGLALFTLGLGKKVLLADNMGFYANAVFDAAEKNWPVSGAEAWLGSFCYTFQLYFDFSGYTDMALGAALMLGISLPENFNAPYRSTGIVDFWRRWHITLGTWLRDFLYIPLGGNRKGRARQYLNLFLTMLIGGVWHGAGWTFAVWGAMHGAMLAVNHYFRASIRGRPLEVFCARPAARAACAALTFFCVNFAWVVFRAESLDGALAMYRPMLGLDLSPDAACPGNYFQGWLPFGLLAACSAICFLCPTSRELLRGAPGRKPAFTPGRAWAAGLAALAFACLFCMGGQSTFLYFQF